MRGSDRHTTKQLLHSTIMLQLILTISASWLAKESCQKARSVLREQARDQAIYTVDLFTRVPSAQVVYLPRQLQHLGKSWRGRQGTSVEGASVKAAMCRGRLLPCLVQSHVFEAVYSSCQGGYGLAKVPGVSSPCQGRCGLAQP